jgi:hypothetical protein
MAFFLLVTRRLVAQRLLAAALLVAMAFTVGVLVAGPIYANGSGRAIVSGTVAQTLVAIGTFGSRCSEGPLSSRRPPTEPFEALLWRCPSTPSWPRP